MTPFIVLNLIINKEVFIIHSYYIVPLNCASTVSYMLLKLIEEREENTDEVILVSNTFVEESLLDTQRSGLKGVV